jgi:aconitate hydratase
MIFAGDLTFNPLTDSLKGSDGKEFKFSEPSGFELPAKGYDSGENTFQAPPTDGATVSVAVSPTSDRLQLLHPFKAWDGNDIVDAPVLIKAKGKCTTDHISAGGPWLKYRGHLENISRQSLLRIAVDQLTPHRELPDWRHQCGQRRGKQCAQSGDW